MALLMLAASLGGWKTAQHARSRPSKATQGRRSQGKDLIRVNPDQLTFGNQWETNSYRHRFHVENQTATEITIARFETSCSCAGVKPSKIKLGPYDSANLEVELDLRKLGPLSPRSESRRVSFWVQPIVQNSTGKARPDKTWVFQGTVMPSVRVENPILTFGTHSHLDISSRVRTTRVHCLVPNSDLRIQCFTTHGGLTAKAKAVTKSAHEITVEWTGSFVPGEHRARLVLQTGDEIPPYTVNLARTVLSDIQASPPAILLGSRRVGEAVTETVTLHSLTGRKLTLHEVRSGDRSIAIHAVHKGGPPSFEVRCLIPKLGSKQATVQAIIVTDSEKKKEEIELPVAWTGMSSSS